MLNIQARMKFSKITFPNNNNESKFIIKIKNKKI